MNSWNSSDRNNVDRAKFELSEKQTEAWQALEDDYTNEVFIGGGAGIGKTSLLCVWQIYRRMTYPRTRGFIGRNSLGDIKESTLITFFREARKLGYVSGVDFKYREQGGTITFKNESVIVLKELFAYPSDPDFQSFGSTEYTDGAIDEAPEIQEKAFNIINSRIRFALNENNLIPKILLTGNPGDHWIRQKYVVDKNFNEVVLKNYQKVILGTLEDNPDKAFKDIYRQQLGRLTNEYDRRRLLYGDWLAEPRTGLEYIYTFSSEKHLRDIKYNPKLPLHITYDFNVNPYMTLLISQMERTDKGFNVNFIKEYCLPHPNNATKEITETFKFDLEHGIFAGHKEGLFYYGDYSGKNKNTLAVKLDDEDIRNNYDMVRSVLKKFIDNRSDRCIPNPPRIKSRNFMVDIFAGKLPINIYFDRGMTTTVKDFHNLKQGADGLMMKEYGIDPVSKIKFEKYGHCVQASYYLVVSAFNDYFQNYEQLAA